jgi:hypothetical protein
MSSFEAIVLQKSKVAGSRFFAKTRNGKQSPIGIPITPYTPHDACSFGMVVLWSPVSSISAARCYQQAIASDAGVLQSPTNPNKSPRTNTPRFDIYADFCIGFMMSIDQAM